MRILFIGDIFGVPGRRIIENKLDEVREQYKIDFCIANAENASHGRGMSMSAADTLYGAGVDFITMGNHTWGNGDLLNFIDDYPVIRPANYSEGLPGRGFDVVDTLFGKIAIINLLGRVSMEPCDNPFICADKCLESIEKEYGGADAIIVDFHAEATSEKIAMAYYLEGRVSAVIGTHTHVQTADDTVLPGGTAYITDAGMTGTRAGVIGMKRAQVLEKFITGMPKRFEPAEGKAIMCGVVIETEGGSLKAVSIEKIQISE
ncbi:MAG: TIGR00282 family metallophosphoesterase [Clostridia bacterium]|nr:TIGR00282 family metallophosphoesterase [Clostridia bacterium]